MAWRTVLVQRGRLDRLLGLHRGLGGQALVDQCLLLKGNMSTTTSHQQVSQTLLNADASVCTPGAAIMPRRARPGGDERVAGRLLDGLLQSTCVLG